MGSAKRTSVFSGGPSPSETSLLVPSAPQIATVLLFWAVNVLEYTQAA